MKNNHLLKILFLLIILITNVTIANTISEYNISGFVTMKDSTPLNRVKIELLDGDQVIGTDSTNKQGLFSISKNLENNQTM